jgi:membrane protein involved in colicin uptake
MKIRMAAIELANKMGPGAAFIQRQTLECKTASDAFRGIVQRELGTSANTIVLDAQKVAEEVLRAVVSVRNAEQMKDDQAEAAAAKAKEEAEARKKAAEAAAKADAGAADAGATPNAASSADGGKPNPPPKNTGTNSNPPPKNTGGGNSKQPSQNRNPLLGGDLNAS